ncbi:MAG: DUF1841 family protein [Gammaproteobacteria bacterium]|nr:DUF1841 family protein [Gammaproteobacteria bacterium]
MFGQDREQLRRFFATSWRKRQSGEPLQGLEQLVSQIVEQHPEYHAQLADDEQLQRDFTPETGETNPWLHMGMHVSLGEQLGADRPAGVRELYRQIAARHGDAHAAEHAMMECLGLVLWEAQRAGRTPDEAAYLECLKRLAE